MTIAIVILSLLLLLFLGLPISASLLISGLLGYILTSGFHVGLMQLPSTVYGSLDSFVVSAIPLYIFMGQIMIRGGVGKDLFDLAQKIVGKVPGGLTVSSIFSSAIFAAISGSSTATVATIGGVALPEMIQRGYDRKQAFGALATAGSLGILIPPSTQFILYSTATNTSVGKLFMAGVLPGVMLACLFAAYSIGYEVFKAKGIRKAIQARQGYEAKLHWRVVGSVLLIPLVLGGIYLGTFTPTEAAAIGVVYALIFTGLIRRSLGWRGLWDATRSTVISGGMIMLLIAGAKVFGNTITYLQVPQHLIVWIQNAHLHVWSFFVIITIFFLILGMFMDSSAAILTTMPILYPVLNALKIDPIWFGVILIVNMEIGAVTPPVGMNLFVIQSLRDDARIGEILRGALPYVIAAFIGLILIMVFPQIALWLPQGTK